MATFIYFLISLVVVQAAAATQIGGDGRDGPLDPSASTTLYTNRPNGEFFFTRIWIPPGVRLTVEGPNPAIFRVQGSVVIDGELVADGKSPQLDGCCAGAAGGPGGFAGGTGNVLLTGAGYVGRQGEGPGGGGSIWHQLGPVPCYGEGGGGGHATPGRTGQYGGFYGQGGKAYGSALPFDLLGGSGGSGGIDESALRLNLRSGAGGGGVLVILADGPILINGTMSVRGGDVENGSLIPLLWGGGGAGGSVLLRSMSAAEVSSNGAVLATGGRKRRLSTDWGPTGGDGFVRFDAYTNTPLLRGKVEPTPTVTTWPWVAEALPPRIGQVWRARLFAVPGDEFFAGVSLGQASVPIPPLGTLLIDMSLAVILGPLAVPRGGIDPSAELSIPIPDDPTLIGLRFYTQAVNVLTLATVPRFTNRIDSVVVR
jgi:hypothetical protein